MASWGPPADHVMDSQPPFMTTHPKPTFKDPSHAADVCSDSHPLPPPRVSFLYIPLILPHLSSSSTSQFPAAAAAAAAAHRSRPLPDQIRRRRQMSVAGVQLPPGFRFHPTDEELVLHYLCRKCSSLPVPAPIIAEIDLYKYDPWLLPGILFFFPCRKD